ncbi:hypothetical protein HK100_008601, partial [Physocladia obscura]
MSSTSVIDFAYPSQVTASSYDSVSASCIPNLCNPKESTDDGEDTGGDDDTQWQSSPAYGATCDPVWIQYDFSLVLPSTLVNMSILYGNESFVFDGQAQGAVRTGPTVSITSTSGTMTNAVAGTDYSFVSTTSANDDEPSRFDSFLPISSLVVIYGVNVTTAAAESTTTVSNGSNAGSSSSLSGGAIAGIAIAAAVVVIA